jgi:NAD(P)H dehydrogenase (quinone)
MNIHIIFHSIHGHCYAMAKEIKKGAEIIEGVRANIFKVPETVSSEIIENMGATEKIKTFSHLPIASIESIVEADAVILGAPTYFGAPSGQMVAYLNQFGEEWVKGALVGKIGSSFTTSSEQNGGAETCLHNLNTFFYHQGMIIASVPTALTYDEMHVDHKPIGGYSYGSSMIAGGMNNNEISEEERKIARLHGKHVAEITKALCIGKKNI